MCDKDKKIVCDKNLIRDISGENIGIDNNCEPDLLRYAFTIIPVNREKLSGLIENKVAEKEVEKYYGYVDEKIKRQQLMGDFADSYTVDKIKELKAMNDKLLERVKQLEELYHDSDDDNWDLVEENSALEKKVEELEQHNKELDILWCDAENDNNELVIENEELRECIKWWKSCIDNKSKLIGLWSDMYRECKAELDELKSKVEDRTIYIPSVWERTEYVPSTHTGATCCSCDVDDGDNCETEDN